MNRPTTLGLLRKAGYTVRSVKDEIRDNLIEKIRRKEQLFPGVIGFDQTVVPALINALDTLYQEWNYKPAGLVSYGGVSAGLRSAAMTKSILTTLKVVPIVEAVAIPTFTTHMDKATGRFTGSEGLERSAQTMLKELARWTEALRTLRP